MPERVRAAVMTAPGVIEIQEFPYPEVQPGAMLMKVEYISLLSPAIISIYLLSG